MDLNQFTKNGKFLMLALDHRGSFKKLMNPQDPDSITDEEVIKLKEEIIHSIEDQFSGVLVDEIYGWSALEAEKKIHPNLTKPFLLPLEKSGYVEEGGERVTELEYNIAEILEMGASGAKLLLYFNPHIESAWKQLETAKGVLNQCQDTNFPYFLEIVTYTVEDLNGKQKDLILDSVKMFLENNIIPDVFKLGYPGSLESCQQLSGLLGNTPWILLTGGGTFDHFKEELEDATVGGAKGFLAGRALWQEVCTLQGEEKQQFLNKTLPERFKVISDICLLS